MSVVFDANYNYDNKYFIKGSYRRDGTSRLPSESRWGNFWAVSGSWRIDQESWYRNGGISHVLTGAKLRASYGVVSITSKSPSLIPSSIIESPLTRA